MFGIDASKISSVNISNLLIGFDVQYQNSGEVLPVVLLILTMLVEIDKKLDHVPQAETHYP